MSTASVDADGSPPISLPSRSRPAKTTMKQHRVLACIQCQNRKIKCNREFPCSHCIKTGVQCVPGNLVQKQRRRRFPERELLDRLRHYEDLLKQHHIDFEPLHPSTEPKEESSPTVEIVADGQESATSTNAPEAARSPSVNFWSAVTQTPSLDDDPHSGSDSDFTAKEMGERMIKKAWEHSNYRKEDLIFGTPLNDTDLSILHPPPVQIFRLWQVYLDNVDPLLKVTHTPTLQPRIIDATSSLVNVEPALSTLMFAIYCISIISLTEEECWVMFAANKADLLSRYHFACQQALMQSAFLRTEDMDCLTALYLYMVSMKPDIDARSLSSSLGIALRIAQRMGIHDESTYGRYSALEAELRRRLWWSLVIFDNRMCEMSNNLKSTVLLPTWDCGVSRNVNDFDLRAELKVMPREIEHPSQAIFTVVRTRIADFLRHSGWYLDFNIPALKSLANKRGLDAFEEQLEKEYLQKCSQEDPLQFMTIWTARGQMAKNRFWDHLAKFPKPSVHQTDAERDVAVSHALRYIECDTQLLSSPLTKRFEWYTKAYSFFPAYIHIVQDLRKRPLQVHARRAWDTMSTDWEARHHNKLELNGNPFFKMFSRIVLLAWEAREAALLHRNLALEPHPALVAEMYQKTTPQPAPAGMIGSGQPGFQAGPMDMNIDDFLMNIMPMPIDFVGQHGPYDVGL